MHVECSVSLNRYVDLAAGCILPVIQSEQDDKVYDRKSLWRRQSTAKGVGTSMQAFRGM